MSGRLPLTVDEMSVSGGIIIPSGDGNFFDSTQTHPITDLYPSPASGDVLIALSGYPMPTSGNALAGMNPAYSHYQHYIANAGFVYGLQTVSNSGNVNGFDITRISYRNFS